MDAKVILLVEDSPEDVLLTRRALQKNRISHELVVMPDGMAALEYLLGACPSESLPAVILLDLKLPKKDGLEVLREIRSYARLKRQPVVILTSSGEEQDITRSYDLGANSYIRKPVDFEQFSRTVLELSSYWLLLNEPPPSARASP